MISYSGNNGSSFPDKENISQNNRTEANAEIFIENSRPITLMHKSARKTVEYHSE